jgi:amidase
VAERFAWARLIPDTKLAAGQAYRARFCAHMAEILGTDGVLLMPTMPDIAPLISDDEAGLESYRNRALQMLCVAGLAGLPQLSLPWATRLGAPLGLSLVGPPGSDRSLVALAQRIVQAHGGSLQAAPAQPGPGTVFSVRLPVPEQPTLDDGMEQRPV